MWGVRLSEGEKLSAVLLTWFCYQATVMLAKLILSAGCCIAAFMATPNWSRIWNLFPVFSFGLCALKLLVGSIRFLCFISNLPNSWLAVRYTRIAKSATKPDDYVQARSQWNLPHWHVCSFLSRPFHKFPVYIPKTKQNMFSLAINV